MAAEQYSPYPQLEKFSMTALALAEMQKLAASFFAAPKKHLIGGKWLDARSGKTFPSTTPPTAR